MTNIVVTKLESDILVVDSRLLADGLGIKHDNFMQTLKNHESKLDSHFGSLLFQTGTRKREVGATTFNYCLLTEIQAVAACTLSRNTDKVVAIKFGLVKAFYQARMALAAKNNPDLEPFALFKKLGMEVQPVPIPQSQPTHTHSDLYLESFKQTLLTELPKVETSEQVKYLGSLCHRFRDLQLKLRSHQEEAEKVIAEMKSLGKSHTGGLN